MSDCPPPGILDRLLAEAIDGAELASVEAHVEECASCQLALDHLARVEAEPVARLLRGRGDVPAADRAGDGPVAFLSRLKPAPAAHAEGGRPGPEAPPHGREEWPEIDGYTILGELGRGGMGVVYKALHLRLNRLVALKMVLAGPQMASQARERFRQEAWAVARLRHPHIVQVYDFGEQGGRPYYSMELVEGGSLAGRLNGAPFATRQAARLVETLALAVDYAHQNGVLHRDLKPANVLVDAGEAGDAAPEGPGDSAHGLRPAPAVKVTDFGLAKQIAEPVEALTQSGMVLGTPSYMAPEQARGQGEALGPTAYVYALGAILYELLTGRPPFRAASPLDTLMQVVHMVPVSVTRLQPRIPRDLSTVCMKCLEKEPRKRYATAGELADDLRRYLDHEPIRARPVGVAGRLSRWGRRNPALAAMVAALAGVTALAFAVVLGEWREEVRARHQAAEARRRAEHANIGLIVDRGLALCERGEVGPGLLWLARGLEKAEVDQGDELAPPIRANLAAWASQLLMPRTSPPQGASITSVAFSPDGRLLLSGAWDSKWANPGPGEAQLWDTRDGWKAVGPALQHPGAVVAVAFSPDGRRALTGGAEGTARLWDTSTGQPVGDPIVHPGPVKSLSFSPDGTWFLTGGEASPTGGEARRWDASTGRPIDSRLECPGPVEAVAISPDGKTILIGCTLIDEAGSPIGGEAWLWDVATGRPIGPALSHSDAVKSVAFSPDGTLVLTGCDDAMARLWDRETGRHFGRPQPHAFPVLAAAFRPDGKAVLTGGGLKRRLGAAQGEARLWDVATGKPLAAPLVHDNLIHSVAFSPDGRFAVTGCRDGRMRIWDVGELRPLREWSLLVPVRAMAYSPDGKLLLAGGGGAERVLAGNSITEARYASAPPISGGGADRGLARLSDAATARPIGPPLEHADPVEGVAFSPDGRTIATGSRDGKARLWDTAGRPLGAPLEQSGYVYGLTFRTDGRALATCSDHGPARLWEVPSGRPIGAPLAHANSVRAVAFCPDGRMVATAGRDGRARLWDAATGRPLLAPLEHGREVVEVMTVAFSPDGRTLLTGGNDNMVRRWDVATGRPLGPPLPHNGVVWVVGFSRDGARFLTVAGSLYRDWGFAQLWDAATAHPFGPPLPHRVSVTAVAFHPGGRLLATGGWEGDIRLWDVTSGRPVGPPFPHPGSVLALAFDPEGRRLAAAGEDGTCRVWAVPEPIRSTPEQVRQWVQSVTEQELDDGGAIHQHGDPERRSGP